MITKVFGPFCGLFSHQSKEVRSMTIQSIGTGSAVLYITAADLKERGLTPASSPWRRRWS